MKAIEAQRFDWIPPALMLAIVLGALALIGSPSTWVTLTVAGLAMGCSSGSRRQPSPVKYIPG